MIGCRRRPGDMWTARVLSRPIIALVRRPHIPSPYCCCSWCVSLWVLMHSPSPRLDPQHGRLYWSCPTADLVALVIHGETAIQPLVHFHPALGKTGPPSCWQELDALCSEADRVVAPHGAAVFEADDLLQEDVWGQGTIGRSLLGGRHGKPLIEAGEEVRQHRARL